MRLLLICPHPDDETLGAGLLLHQAVSSGAVIRVLFLTDGERNAIPQVLVEKRINRPGWATRRRREALLALEALGVPSHCAEFWALPDQRLWSVRGELADRLAIAIDEFRPDVLIGPSVHDLHPDHIASALASGVAVASRCWRGQLDHLVYTIHGPQIDGEDFVLRRHANADRRKQAALQCHVSQLIVSRKRLEAICQRPEVFRMFSIDAALPRPRFRALRRLMHVLFEGQVGTGTDSKPASTLNPAEL